MTYTTLQKVILLTVLTIGLHINSFSQNFRKEKQRIIEVLEKAYESDQKVRQEFNTCISTKGSRDEECKIKRKELGIQDSINQKIVGEILDQYGWLSPKKTSEKANRAFFYVIQHAPLEFQSKYAILIDKAFKNGEINSTEYAFFVDRYRSKQGKAQLYGTQAETDNLGNSYLYPLENWRMVNSLRKGLNLPALDFSQIPEHNLYPLIINGDTITLIGHIFDKSNNPISDAIVSIDSKTIGHSNDKGFFIINLKRPTETAKIIVQVKDKWNTAIIKGQKDFYNIYMQF